MKCVRIRASTISRRMSSRREQQDQRPVRQRAGTLRYMGPPRPGPLINRPRGDKGSQPGKPSQANRGPKNQGRSPAPVQIGASSGFSKLGNSLLNPAQMTKFKGNELDNR